jgi:hypothetical protein
MAEKPLLSKIGILVEAIAASMSMISGTAASLISRQRGL